MRKIIKIAVWALSVLITTVGMLLLLLFLGYFNNSIKHTLVDKVNEILPGQLSVSSIDGNWFSNISLNQIEYVYNGDTLVKVDRLILKYNLLYLAAKEVNISELILVNPCIKAVQYTDTVWFYNKFLPTEQSGKTSSEPSNWLVKLKNVELQNGCVFFKPLRSDLTDTITHLFVFGGMDYSANQTSVDISHLSMSSKLLQQQIRHFSTRLAVYNNHFDVDTLLLKLPNSSLNGNASFLDLNNFSANFIANVGLADLTNFLPHLQIKTGATTQINIHSKVGETDILVDLRALNGQNLSLKAKLFRLAEVLNDVDSNLLYNMHLVGNGLVPGQWSGLAPDNLLINAKIDVKGSGLALKSLNVNFNADFNGASFENIAFKNLIVSGHTTYSLGQISLKAGGHWGKILSNWHISELGKQNIFNGQVNFSQLTPQFFMSQKMPYPIALNGQISANGYFSNIHLFNIYYALNLYQSSIDSVVIDTLNINGYVDAETYKVDSLWAKQGSNIIGGNGTYSTKGTINAFMQLHLVNDSILKILSPQPVSVSKLDVSVAASGLLDSILLNGHLIARNLSYSDFNVAQFRSSFDGIISSKNIVADVRTQLSDVSQGTLLLDSVVMVNRLSDSFMDTELTVRSAALGNVNAKVNHNLSIPFRLNLAKLDYAGLWGSYFLANSSAQIKFNGDTLDVNNFKIGDTSNNNFSAEISGMASLKGAQNLIIDVKALDLKSPLIANFIDLKGQTSAQMQIRGSAEYPEVSLNVAANEIGYLNWIIPGFVSQNDLSNGLLKSSSRILGRFNDSVSISLESPLTVSWNKDEPQFKVSNTFNGRIYANNLVLGNYQTFVPGMAAEKLDGIMNIDIQASGSMSHPDFNGNFSLEKGAVKWRTYGIDYKDIAIKLRAQSGQIAVDSLLVKSQTGYLKGSGTLTIDSLLAKNHYSQANFNLIANNFNLVNHQHYNLTLNADNSVKSNTGVLEFGGNVEIIKSMINLDGLMDIRKNASHPDKPLLVAALEPVLVDSSETSSVTVTESWSSSALLDALKGRMKIVIPRNTWIRSSDMSLELMGDIDLVKNGPDFELFGTMGIRRGQYALFGKKLRISSGQLVFKGGSTFNPEMEIEAFYVFRDNERIKRTLDISIMGTLSQPIVAFLLDNEEVSEANAVSYLIFGKPLGQLDQVSGNSNIGEMTSDFITGSITNQLVRSIGNQLNVDLLEVDAGQNWDKTSMTVGKYLTNNLFVMYQRAADNASSVNENVETIVLEYEMARNLFLKLMSGSTKHSGVDIIFKFERDYLFNRKKRYGSQTD